MAELQDLAANEDFQRGRPRVIAARRYARMAGMH
jgi:hypothetical protein